MQNNYAIVTVHHCQIAGAFEAVAVKVGVVVINFLTCFVVFCLRSPSGHAVSCDQTTSVPITSQPGPVVSCDVPISVPTSAIEPPNAPNLKPERTKDRLSENEEEGDSEGGEGDSSSRRRRRRHSSASEGEMVRVGK